MDCASHSLTSTTLLGRLQNGPTNQEAWSEFVDRYGPKIHAWCSELTKNQADVEDVTQTVLLRLVKYFREFKYEPQQSFRGWLRTVTRNAWRDYCDKRSRAIAGSGDSVVQDRLHSLEAREELIEKLDEIFDRELLEEAICRVRLRVKPQTWDAFRLKHFEGLSGATIAARLTMNVATVYVACSKVQKMLQQEIERLEHLPQNEKSDP